MNEAVQEAQKVQEQEEENPDPQVQDEGQGRPEAAPGPSDQTREEGREKSQEQGEEEAQEDAPRPQLRDLDPTRLVEAALFTAGRPVGVEELAQATGLAPDVVKQAAKSLEQEYEELGDRSALEVHLAGAKWAMQLKTVYVEHAQSLARMEIPKKTLKTLALIAFHQPMLQSELVDMIGSKTYEHVRELIEIGLVKSRPEGLSKRLTTSPEFPEYFGIPATDTQEIRVYLAKKVGLSLSELKGKPDLDDFDEGSPASPELLEAVAREIDEEKGEEVREPVDETAEGTVDSEADEGEEPIEDHQGEAGAEGSEDEGEEASPDPVRED